MTGEKNPGDYHPILILRDIEDLKSETLALKAELFLIKKARAEEEKRRLRWGISTLGSIVLALGAAVWALLPDNAEGAWQFLRGGR